MALGCGIGGSREGGNTDAKIVVNRLVQLGEVQRRLRLNTSSRSSSGTAVGCGCACGFMVKNRGRLLREGASTDLLSTPAMWRADIEMSYVAQKKNSERKSRMRMSWGSCAEPLLSAKTTATLSQ